MQLIEGSPQPDVSLSDMARQIGISDEDAERLVARLETAGKLRREGERLIAIGSDGPGPGGRR
jgi:DNA-binding IclR family transcriptional regulator